MSGINWPANQGRLVPTLSPATTASASQGRPPRPFARRVRTISQAVSADCRTAFGQNDKGTPA